VRLVDVDRKIGWPDRDSQPAESDSCSLQLGGSTLYPAGFFSSLRERPVLFFSFSLSLPLFHSPAVLPLSALPAGCTPPSASERKKSTSSRNLSSYLLSITYPLRNLKISLASEKQYSLSIPRLGFERHAAESSPLAALSEPSRSSYIQAPQNRTGSEESR